MHVLQLLSFLSGIAILQTVAMTLRDSKPGSNVDALPASKQTESALLAQELASESSWADSYVGTPSNTIMTPASEPAELSAYATPDEAPPTYDSITSVASSELPAFPAEAQQPISRPFQPNRCVTQHETSHSITGTFTLHDCLDLKTESGTINIRLDVRPGKEPAILKLAAKSGSIHVDDMQASEWNCRTKKRSPGPSPLAVLFGWAKKSEIEPPPTPQSDDPRKQPGQHLEEPEEVVPRVIHATIETKSGSVSAHLLLTPGSRTRIETSSGSINLRMSTADTTRQLTKLEQEDSRKRDLTSYLSTVSGSGSQNIHINQGFGAPSGGDIVSSLKASHKVLQSGSLGAYYPRDWQGLVHGSSGGSGSVNVHGNGLTFDQRGTREVYAWRGTDEPDLEKGVELRCDGSGSITFTC